LADEHAFGGEILDAAILTEFKDISGMVVRLQDPERSPRRHRDHLGLGH